MLRRFALLSLSLCVAALSGAGAEATLKKLRARTVNITDSPDNSPNPLFTGNECCLPGPFDSVFLDDSTAGSPRLKKLALRNNTTITVDLTGTFGPNTYIFLSNHYLEGPGPFPKPVTFTGTGHTADTSTIRWGIVTGWTITGSQYCVSSPPVVCNIAVDGSETTGDPQFWSDFYDLGTWTFHGTGFTAAPFVQQYFTIPGNFGNNQVWMRAFFVVDATVPALSLVGVALIGGSMVAGGLAALHRRRQG